MSSKRFQFAVVAKTSRIDGKGLFTQISIPRRRKIGELTGERIRTAVADRRASKRRRIAIVGTRDGWAIDASRGGNDLKFVNHSCDPNIYIRVSYGRVEFYARRDIQPREELTCDYGDDSYHAGKLRCRCGSKNCRGYI